MSDPVRVAKSTEWSILRTEFFCRAERNYPGGDMTAHLIYWPVLVQVMIPLIVLLVNAKRKAADVKAGAADLKKAALDNEAWSLPVVLTSKNLANQFQIPVLFYVVCFILASLDAVSIPVLAAAWAFVLSRCVHAYVHVTSNYVPMRMRSFIVGVVVLFVMIVMSALALLGA